MSEQKAQRSTQEVQSEYTSLCVKAGNLQYEITQKQKDLSLINDRLRDLNFEYVAAKNFEAEVAKKVAEEKQAKETAEAPKEQPKLEVVKESTNV